MSEEKKISLEDLEDLLEEDNASTSHFSFRDLLSMVMLNLRWFVISVVLCLIVAGAYLFWARPSVTVVGKMQLKESKKESGISASLAALSSSIPFGLGSSLGGVTSGDVEVEIMKSTLVVRDVINDLGLHTEYRLSRWGKNRMLYQDQPVNVVLEKSRLEWFDQELPLTTHQIELKIQKNSEGYTIDGMLKENKEEMDIPSQTFAKLPATIKTDVGTMTISENQLLTMKQRELYQDGYTLEVSIIPPMIAANQFLQRLEIEPATKKAATVLNITLKDEHMVRGIDFINHMVEVYNRRANEDKNEELMRTDEFVNERLAKVDAELGSSDADWQTYKTKFHMTDPDVDAKETVTMKSGYETQLVEIGAQLRIMDDLISFVNNPTNRYAPIPSGIGLDKGSSTNSITEKYNESVLERNRLLKSLNEQAPQVQLLTKTIDDLHPSVVAALRQSRQAIELQRQSVEREFRKYQGRIGKAPVMERVLTDVGRQREIKQAVYLVMLQKREQTAMDLVDASEKGKLIDETQIDPTSINPKKKVIIFAAFFLGFLIPFGILFLIRLFKSKVESCQDVEALTSRSIIGEIPPGDDVEAVRILRTNLLQSLKPDQKVILMASDNDGDGKTYLAHQLDDSLKVIGKKVLYMDLDLRSSSLRSQSLSKGHPADIIASDDLAAKIQQAKANNDYVILDSPSLSRYQDAYLIAQYADATCFVVKPGTTKKSVIASLDKELRLPNPNIIINASDMSKKKFRYLFKTCSFALLSLLLLTGCMSTKNVSYFQNREAVNTAVSQQLYDAKIMPKDILQIRVFTVNPEASEPFNLMKTANSSSNINPDQGSVYNYLVDNDGNVSMPVLGALHLGGLTKNEAESLIVSKIKPYLSDTENVIVHVRMINYKYAVLGEVNKPGVFTTPNEKISVLEALAQAGDLTLYGERDKIFVIREDAAGQKAYHQLNINDANIVNSPYYYLQQNDVVYVEPNKAKARSSYFTTSTSMWFTLTSMLMSVATFILALTR